MDDEYSSKNWLILTLFSVWISSTILALWLFQQSKIQPFLPEGSSAQFYQAPHYEAVIGDLQKAYTALAKPSTVYHFWNPNCVCNLVSQRHFDRLLDDYSYKPLKVIIVAHPSTKPDTLKEFKRLNGDRFTVIEARTLNMGMGIPSSPSLAITNPYGELTYFGPYGFGAFCTDRENGFLSKIIQDQNSPDSATFINVIGDGCFCPWS